MLVEFLASKETREVSTEAAQTLVRAKVARVVEATDGSEVASTGEPVPNISPRTGKAKRVYRRRDLTAE